MRGRKASAAGYRGSAGRCPQRRRHDGAARMTPASVRMAGRCVGGRLPPRGAGPGRTSGVAGVTGGSARGIVGVFLLGGDRIDPGQPAMEIDIGATLGTEGAQALALRLAADDAGFRRGAHRHGLDVGMPCGDCDRDAIGRPWRCRRLRLRRHAETWRPNLARRSRVLAKMAPLSQSASTIAAPPDPIATLARPDHPASPSPRFSYRNVASTAGAGTPTACPTPRRGFPPAP
jgi:hypothetical protein